MDTLEKPVVDSSQDVRELVEEYVNDNDPNIRTHIINPPNNLHIWQEGMSSQDIVDVARANGLPVVALCGHTWVPKRNPDKYPACNHCMHIAGQIIKEMG